MYRRVGGTGRPYTALHTPAEVQEHEEKPYTAAVNPSTRGLSGTGVVECSHPYYNVVVSNKPTTVRLTDEQKAGLDAIGEREDRSRSWLISKAVDEYIARHQRSEEATTDGGEPQ
ncbi:ribbon-helix-helix domain-containing protein [Nonomuraea sp. NPDC026600]|uniref:CopG family ribbon-helix-helix protein n=1 Tax=Nonomuraea sp. NPDC026600 TaxID=3155363 RepID=UPI003406E300